MFVHFFGNSCNSPSEATMSDRRKNVRQECRTYGEKCPTGVSDLRGKMSDRSVGPTGKDRSLGTHVGRPARVTSLRTSERSRTRPMLASAPSPEAKPKISAPDL